MGMAKPAPWDSHRVKSLAHPRHAATLNCHSDLCLESSNWEGLHNSTGWLGFHLHLLTKGHPHSCLGGGLHTSLDPAKTRDREDTCLLHFCGGKGGQALKEPSH